MFSFYFRCHRTIWIYLKVIVAIDINGRENRRRSDDCIWIFRRMWRVFWLRVARSITGTCPEKFLQLHILLFWRLQCIFDEISLWKAEKLKTWIVDGVNEMCSRKKRVDLTRIPRLFMNNIYLFSFFVVKWELPRIWYFIDKTRKTWLGSTLKILENFASLTTICHEKSKEYVQWIDAVWRESKQRITENEMLFAFTWESTSSRVC